MVSMLPKPHSCIQSSSLLPRFSSLGSLAALPAFAGAAAVSPSAGSASIDGASSAACPHANSGYQHETIGVSYQEMSLEEQSMPHYHRAKLWGHGTSGDSKQEACGDSDHAAHLGGAGLADGLRLVLSMRGLTISGLSWGCLPSLALAAPCKPM